MPAKARMPSPPTKLGQAMGDDPALVQKMAGALAAEPLLRAGAMLSEPVKAYLQAAAASVVKPSR